MPSLTPDRIKALLRDSDRPLTDTIDELSLVDAARRFATDGGRLANQGLTPNEYIDPATGGIDYTRSSWSRSSWSNASDLLRSSWSRSSWSMAPAEQPAEGYNDTVNPARRAGAGRAGAAPAGRPAGPSNTDVHRGTAADRAADTPGESCRT